MRVGGHPALSLHSSNESGESRNDFGHGDFGHDDSTINIVVVISIVVIIIIIFYPKKCPHGH